VVHGPLQGWLRWVVAAALPACATLVNVLLQASTGTVAPFLSYFPAVVMVALWSGRWPAYGALLLSSVAVYSAWLAPLARTFVMAENSYDVALAGFLVAGLLIVEVAERSRRLEHRAEALAESRHEELARLEAAEHDARETQARLALALEAGEMGTWEVDARMQHVYASERTRQMVGATHSEGQLERLFRRVHPDDRARLEQTGAAAIRDGTAFETEFRVLSGDDIRWISAKALCVSDARRGTRLVGVAEDVTRARLALREIEQKREELQRMLDLLPVAVTTDPQADHVTVSESLREILRLAPDQDASYTGPGRDAIPYRAMRDGVEIPGDELPMVVAARQGREVRNFEVDLHFGDGLVRSLLISAAPLFDGEGKVRGAIGVHVDVTALKEAKRALQAADRQKDEFLATLAHELRNPMAPIRYAAAMLRPDMPMELVPQLRETIERQSAHMARLLDDLLDMSRVTRNVIQLQRRVLDLREAVQDAIGGYGPAIEATRLRLDVSLPEHPVWVDGDPARLVQIVGNLVGNAVKYTDMGGSVSVALTVVNGRARVDVRDTGVGFDSTRSGQLFQLFSQLHPELQSSKGGLGIGLAVVRSLVDLHGGSVSATSDGPGRGSQFTVVLPMVDAPRRIVMKPTTGTIDAAGLRILVVDDNRDAAEALGMLLGLQGFTVQLAHDGTHALQAAAEFEPAVVLLDLGLPDLDGREVGRRMRARPDGWRSKIVAITGWGRAEDRRETLQAGFDAHLVKPVDPDRLLRLLAGLLESASCKRTQDEPGVTCALPANAGPAASAESSLGSVA
jgi:signal transduction histidine kinase/ActR/RegA family two-component response regulator